MQDFFHPHFFQRVIICGWHHAAIFSDMPKSRCCKSFKGKLQQRTRELANRQHQLDTKNIGPVKIGSYMPCGPHSADASGTTQLWGKELWHVMTYGIHMASGGFTLTAKFSVNLWLVSFKMTATHLSYTGWHVARWPSGARATMGRQWPWLGWLMKHQPEKAADRCGLQSLETYGSLGVRFNWVVG